MRKDIYVVLGVHRGGTCAVARALQVFGVRLGDHLTSAAQDNNPNGFWEDVDAHLLNQRALAALDSTWDRVRPLDAEERARLRAQDLCAQATELLRDKTAGAIPFGFKDPRTAIVLPMWQQAFDACALAPRYILAIRNPQSVARALRKSDGLDTAQAYWLWLHHTLASLEVLLGDAPCAVLDYDALLLGPDAELRRVACGLGCEVDAAELERFKRDFLDADLRHAQTSAAEFEHDRACAPIVLEVFAFVSGLAQGAPVPADLQARSERWRAELERHAPAFAAIDVLSARVRALESRLAEADAQMVEVRTLLRAEVTKAVNEAQKNRGEAAMLANKHQQAMAVIEAMVASHSWRVTAPLRACSRALRGLRLARVAAVARRVAGALHAEVRRHGVRRVIARMPYYWRRRSQWLPQILSEPQVDAELFHRPATHRVHPDLGGVLSPIDAAVSVVIPTLNAGAEFGLLLRKLREQRGLRSVEIIVVDSGSSDDTVAVARAAGAVVIEITQAEFSHSGARNRGAQAARGDYLLFMVQDAYPVGDGWAWGMLRFLLDHADTGLRAVSCAETPRSDSDVMYDAMIDTHYRFLGCRDRDRIGMLRGSSHMALRQQGQLSDVACLIARETFDRYRYRGDYAEDLDLGIRIIRDGGAVAMLASIKVVHSHNRPAWYYFKRSFVDVVFLVEMFADFSIPPIDSLTGLFDAIASVGHGFSTWLEGWRGEQPGGSFDDAVAAAVATVRTAAAAPHAGAIALGDARLDAYLAALDARHLAEQAEAPGSSPRSDQQVFADMFAGRLEHFAAFVREVYPRTDKHLHDAFAAAMSKVFAATAGAALGFAYMQFKRAGDARLSAMEPIFNELKAGV